jgi:aspartyl-tRNA(Asn)/glutamyl-tRNA(Gln) amidotransferase subunit A
MDTVIEIADAVRKGERRATDVLEECLGAIEAANGELNAFVHLDPDQAEAAAREVDARVARGEDPGLLAGVPFGVKDLEDCAGMPTSHGSLLFKGRAPVETDSVHVARLRAAGAVPVGKTAAPEFGIVAFTSTRAWGTTRNPWDRTRTPGGSSGGSAAAVAAGMVPFCTASDGGGSIRIPAAFSGLLGHKPSFGRVPHERSAASQTTSIGALTTTVADAARHLDVAAGPHGRDRTSLPPVALSYEQAVESLDTTGLRAAWSVDLGFAVVEPEVARVSEAAAADLFDAAGLERVEVPVSLTDPVRIWLESGAADLWTGLEKGMYPERAEDFEDLTRLILQVTSGINVPDYARTLTNRYRLEEEVAALFEEVDVLLTPSTAVPAFEAEGPMPHEVAGQSVAPAMAVPFTMLANLCWNPAVSLPAGFSSGGLPVGLQVIGRRHADDVVLRLARLFEQTRPWPRHAPAG